eukprot:763658-Hanusia_phi.AAC.13
MERVDPRRAEVVTCAGIKLAAEEALAQSDSPVSLERACAHYKQGETPCHAGRAVDTSRCELRRSYGWNHE